MPKASVDITSASREEIEGLLAEFGLEGYSSDYTYPFHQHMIIQKYASVVKVDSEDSATLNRLLD